MKKLIVTALFAVILVVVSGEEHHKRCCGTCKANYPHGHHLKHSCLHGCRLYSMIYLAHDKSIKNDELSNMCSKSCKRGFTGGAITDEMDKACNVGCKEQARVFSEHGMSDHGAKMSVMHGIGLALPDMHSPSPFHQRIFQQMRQMHARMMEAMKNAKHAIVQRIQIRIHSMPPGPDGKPRYQVEIHQRRIPLSFGHPMFGNSKGKDQPSKPPIGPDGHRPLLGGDDHDMLPHGPHHGHHGHHGEHHGDHGEHHGHHGHHGPMYRVRHFFVDMPDSAKTCLRWSLFALLLVSFMCFIWVFWRACRSLAAASAQRQRLSITKAIGKKKPCVQSGDIFYVDVGDKKPLIEDDAVDVAAAEAKKEEA
ncbi:hypothetical protein BOX15_Mlig016508g2 [Macrostomum lignano]|uniref:Uncharacterized protein n=1 Tax=Macrostomum lignano TaxID=282301 RepID=A0A267EWT3_9PLAT|nr:hypothetical protein BOX15_Mlig016508g2 [Macrostomum lignano]